MKHSSPFIERGAEAAGQVGENSRARRGGATHILLPQGTVGASGQGRPLRVALPKAARHAEDTVSSSFASVNRVFKLVTFL